MSNRPTGIDAPGMRDTLTVQDADTRKEKVVRLSDVVRHFDSLADIPEDTFGPVWLADGSKFVGGKSGLIPTNNSSLPGSSTPIVNERTASITDYTVSGSATNEILDGQETVKLSSPISTSAHLQKDVALNFNEDPNSPILLIFNLDNLPLAATNQYEFWVSGGTNLSSANRSMVNQTGLPGWNIVPVYKNHVASDGITKGFTANGAAAFDFAGPTGSIRIRSLGHSSGALSINVHSVVDGVYERPKIAITIDDGLPTAYSVGYLEAKKRRIKTTQFLIFNKLSTSGFITLAQAGQMADDPNCYIGVHGEFRWDNDGNGAGLDPFTEIMRNVNGLKNLGLSDGLFAAWPNGNFAANDKTIARDPLAAAGIKGCRSVTNRLLYFYKGLFNPQIIHSFPLNSGRTIAQAKALIDTAILWGTSVTFYAHEFGSVAGGTTWTTADYIELLDYIALKRSQGLIDDVTFSELLNHGFSFK